NYTSVTALLAGTTADKRSLGTPVINGDLSLTGALNVPVGALQLNGDTTAATVLVSGTGILSIDGFNALNATTVNVTGGAGAEINSVPGAGMISIVADDLTVDFGNFIRTDGLGCGASQSFDHATTFTCVNFGAGVTAGFGEGGDYAFSAGGAGYGGVGGIGNGGSGGAAGDVYGATGLPLHLGSGGGDASVPGGAGGGAFNLDISGTLQVDGILSANGAAGGSSTWPGGGGSGGGIHIFTGNLQGAGTITANGGAGGNASAPTIAGGGGGGGGRILINYSGSNTFINPLSCTGGAGGSPSGLPGGGGSCPAPALGSKTTTLGNGNDPAPMTVEPGTMGVVLDAFSFSSNSIDTVTALTVTTTNTVAISKVEIWDAALTTQYFSSVTVPSGNDWNFSGGLAIPSLPVLPPAPFSVVVDFNDHTMAPGMYPVTGMVTGFTSSHTPVLQDTGSSTVTVDNTPAADVAGLSGTTGDTLNILEWTNPGDVDFADVLILRETAGPVGVGPVEGTTYLPGNMIGGATVVYSGPDESFSDFGL
ncbi:MAG TPA: hypothetical protein VLB09_05300, partial [Nitrospiria bacterium]|nr:hypothetical protein [Nitrospiria bacterium]